MLMKGQPRLSEADQSVDFGLGMLLFIVPSIFIGNFEADRFGAGGICLIVKEMTPEIDAGQWCCFLFRIYSSACRAALI